MSVIAFRSPLILALIISPLSGCGLTQSVVDGTASATKAIFYKQIKTLYLDFSARTALNTDETDMATLSVPAMVRVYQLRDGKAVAKATYQSLLTHGESVLQDDLLSWLEVVVKPGEGARLDMPMEREATCVAVVGLFRSPDTVKNTWRIVISREQLDPDNPRVIELAENALVLKPPKE
ncbi:type VI secretion system lipoprotein TssJ [Sodalis sp. dw_96]|uniref:type VI secretion system lipoprotein TssJ n=1 Tax=Sodalis sp. dw_96 TaxID=2719794 RepID=UPI001BD52F6A|nr:type VI secretion system lipoprotein TssJ [Sodalis sp. dw_96]